MDTTQLNDLDKEQQELRELKAELKAASAKAADVNLPAKERARLSIWGIEQMAKYKERLNAFREQQAAHAAKQGKNSLL